MREKDKNIEIETLIDSNKPEDLKSALQLVQEQKELNTRYYLLSCFLKRLDDTSNPELRIFLTELIIKELANTYESLYNQYAIRALMKERTEPLVFSQDAKKALRELVLTARPNSRRNILAIYVQDEDIKKEFKRRTLDYELKVLPQRVAIWPEIFVLARMGDKDAQRLVVKSLEKLDKMSILNDGIRDAAFTQSRIGIEFIVKYLNDDESWPPSEGDMLFPVGPKAQCPAFLLSKIIANFPIKHKRETDYSIEEIRECRKWMKRNWDNLKFVDGSKVE